jgi:hypothetical protein
MGVKFKALKMIFEMKKHWINVFVFKTLNQKLGF